MKIKPLNLLKFLLALLLRVVLVFGFIGLFVYLLYLLLDFMLN